MYKFLISLLLVLILSPGVVCAQEDLIPELVDYQTETAEVKAEVVEIVSDEIEEGKRQMIFKAVSDEEEYLVDSRYSYTEGLRYDIKVGTQVYLQTILINGELSAVFLDDIVRTSSLFWILLIFIATILAIGLWRGVGSLIGLSITLAILLGILLPKILSGADPVLWTVACSIVILGVNMHIAHGLRKSTLFAYGSTIVGLILTLIFAKVFVAMANLSGLAGEETVLLYLNSGVLLFPKGILLSGIILGAVGVLDDIAITQTETVEELRNANKDLSQKELFVSAMRVGRHHIASTVNTLVLAYAGVALPLLLLFMITQGMTPERFLNEELVAEEIVRTLAGTMALVLTVPVATWFAVLVKNRTS